MSELQEAIDYAHDSTHTDQNDSSWIEEAVASESTQESEDIDMTDPDVREIMNLTDAASEQPQEENLQNSFMILQNEAAKFAAEAQSVNWDALGYQERERLSRYFGNWQNRIQMENSRIMTEHQNRMSNFMEKENESLLEKIPEWADAEQAKAGKQELRNYLKNRGFNDNEIKQIYDHRVVKTIRDAMLNERAAKNLHAKHPEDIDYTSEEIDRMIDEMDKEMGYVV